MIWVHDLATNPQCGIELNTVSLDFEQGTVKGMVTLICVVVNKNAQILITIHEEQNT